MAARLSEAEHQLGQAVGFGGNPPPIVASNYKSIHKNTLIGSVDLEIPRWHLVVKGCLWHRRGEREWINFPAREWVGQTGNKQYVEIIKFTDRDAADRFQAAALGAVHAIAGHL